MSEKKPWVPKETPAHGQVPFDVCDDCGEKYHGDDIAAYLREVARHTPEGDEWAMLCENCESIWNDETKGGTI